MQLTVSISDTPLTLEGESYKNLKGSADLKQNYNKAKFERSCFNGVWENANFKIVFFPSFKWGDMWINSLEYVLSWKKKVIY